LHVGFALLADVQQQLKDRALAYARDSGRCHNAAALAQ
jgi:hypothetical protein